MTKGRPMTPAQTRDRRRFRLAANDNEVLITDETDVEGHRLAANDNDTVVDEVAEVDAGQGAGNDDETTVEGPPASA